jgi:hypothetical protein
MMPNFGTVEFSAELTKDRQPGVQHALAWLAFSHLPIPLQSLSMPFLKVAVDLIGRVPTDSAELTTALGKLVEAKDSAVRAGILNDYGRPGPVPRPADVVDPPSALRTPLSMATVDLPPFSPETTEEQA